MNETSNRGFLKCNGDMGRQIAEQDWSAHPLGAIEGWPERLRSTLSVILNSGFPAYIMWGKAFYVLYNDAYRPILGEKVKLGQGVPLGDLWPEIKEAVCAIAEHALAGGQSNFEDQPFVLERHGKPEKAYFTFSYGPILDESGDAVGVACMIIETTDKVNTHARLKESEERLSISLDASGNIGTWSYDPKTNETIVDERFSALFQVNAALAREGAELERFTNVIHEQDRERVLAAIATAIKTGDLYDIDYRIPQKSGETVWVNTKGRMFGDRFAGVAVDITERKLADDRLRKLADVLSEASQRKTEFLATLAHELRNPLAPLRTGLELMCASMSDPATLSKIHTLMQRQVDQMVHLIDDLLDVSRISRGKIALKKSVMDVNSAISSAIEASLPQMEKAKHELRTEMLDEPILIHADSTRLAQILGNILTNAAKYTPSGGIITISARCEFEQAVISVTDNGVGIAPESLLTIFEMFNQVGRDTAHSPGGLGVGLALVRQLVELHGGSVEAVSPGIDQGSTFLLRMPLAADDGAMHRSVDQAALADGEVPRQNFSILIADDNIDAASSLAELLQLEGHLVQTAADGDEALRVMQSFQPDLIFLDIGMPNQNGYEVAMKIRAIPSLSHIMLVALTGWGTDEDRTRSREAGFNRHLTKPIGRAEITEIFRSLEAERK